MFDFEKLLQAIPTPLMILDRNLCFLRANDCYLTVTNRSWADLEGRYVFDAFPETPERLAVIRAAFEKGLAGEETHLERLVYAIAQPDGSYADISWDLRHIPVRARDDSIVGVMQHTLDVSAEVAAERMRDVISQEYDHRVRNILTKVSAIARRTARGTTTMAQFIKDFEPRIASMARAHQMLVHGGWERLGLTELVESELQPYSPQVPGQIVTDGPNVALSSRVAQALGMALHELATNAVKYGALGRPEGRLRVTWRTAADGTLSIDWQESGMRDLTSDSKVGFGSSIIDRVLPAETGGTVTRTIGPDGLNCAIIIPAPREN
ncbi:sensor histidine kinase [Sandarakinorhabdus sp. DWP1-3-1]|uniref:sensor histidine kinase n=1 Tax=Sandarakinorhabdus sp. DWP1-3-1 TaxID=2804627 RepID=UPI003CF40924